MTISGSESGVCSLIFYLIFFFLSKKSGPRGGSEDGRRERSLLAFLSEGVEAEVAAELGCGRRLGFGLGFGGGLQYGGDTSVEVGQSLEGVDTRQEVFGVVLGAGVEAARDQEIAVRHPLRLAPRRQLAWQTAAGLVGARLELPAWNWRVGVGGVDGTGTDEAEEGDDQTQERGLEHGGFPPKSAGVRGL